MAALPSYNAKDRLIFTEECLTTSLESTLKNFFRENSGISNGGEFTLYSMSGKIPVQLILLDNVNRYFSAIEQSQDTEAYIGVCFLFVVVFFLEKKKKKKKTKKWRCILLILIQNHF